MISVNMCEKCSRGSYNELIVHTYNVIVYVSSVYVLLRYVSKDSSEVFPDKTS